MIVLEQWWTNQITRGYQGWRGFLFFLMMLPIACLYYIGLKIRHFLYDHRILPLYESPVPIISVGSIFLGGVGKTPFVCFLLQHLEGAIAVVARGYRSYGDKLHVVSKGDGPLIPVEQAGDELWMIAERFPHTIVIKSKDRERGIEEAVRLGAQVIILDDGMQHRRVKTNINIALDPQIPSRLFPLGLLRDLPERMEQTDWIIHTLGDGEREVLGERPYLRYTATGVKCEDGSEHKTLSGKRVGIFCAIARPERFKRTVLFLGGDVVKTWYFADHWLFDQASITMIAKASEGLDMVLCTGKDRVKLQELAGSLPPSKLGVVECQFIMNASVTQLINQIKTYLIKE